MKQKNNSEHPVCPICGAVSQKPLGKGLFLCEECRCAFNTAHEIPAYNEDYFTGDYLKQYGRTYEDDFEHIYKAGATRLSRIKDIGGQLGSLLDIGCALGFFLKAALDAGYTPVRGIEISAYAAGYCKQKFGFDVAATSFEKTDFDNNYAAITCWYFLEHTADPKSAVEKISAALSQGGVFAFSAPSVFGPMFRRHRAEWLASRPVDHRVDFSPAAAKRLLAAAGFRKVRVYAGGIHPERVLHRTSRFYKPFAFVYRLFAQLTAYSDTIEVYGVKG